MAWVACKLRTGTCTSPKNKRECVCVCVCCRLTWLGNWRAVSVCQCLSVFDRLLCTQVLPVSSSSSSSVFCLPSHHLIIDFTSPSPPPPLPLHFYLGNLSIAAPAMTVHCSGHAPRSAPCLLHHCTDLCTLSLSKRKATLKVLFLSGGWKHQFSAKPIIENLTSLSISKDEMKKKKIFIKT